VQFWYFPGERIGKEFLYPKDQAERIAARTGLDVRTETGVVEGDGIAAVEPAVSAEAALENAPAAAQPSAAAGSLAGNRGIPPQADADLPAEADVDAGAAVVAQAEPAPEPAVSPDTSARPIGTSGQAEGQIARADELPRTASPLALSGLLGLLSLAGAAGLRMIRK
jgi:hypothetical protein